MPWDLLGCREEMSVTMVTSSRWGWTPPPADAHFCTFVGLQSGTTYQPIAQTLHEIQRYFPWYVAKKSNDAVSVCHNIQRYGGVPRWTCDMDISLAPHPEQGHWPTPRKSWTPAYDQIVGKKWIICRPSALSFAFLWPHSPRTYHFKYVEGTSYGVSINMSP